VHTISDPEIIEKSWKRKVIHSLSCTAEMWDTLWTNTIKRSDK